MRRLPSALESPHVREAFIAGASILDTPESPAAWGAIIRWPGRKMEPIEIRGRVPVYDADGREVTTFEYDDHRDDMAEYLPIGNAPVPHDGLRAYYKRYPRYPGTIVGAEWIACEAAITLARRLETPGTEKFWAIGIVEERARPSALYQHDALPLRLYTTRREIVDFLEGRAPVAHAAWLRRIQTRIASYCHGKLVKRRGASRPFFAPQDRPFRDKREPSIIVSFAADGVPVYAQLITPKENLRTANMATSTLRSETHAPLYTGW